MKLDYKNIKTNHKMNTEQFYIKRGYPQLDQFDKKVAKFDYYELLDFAEAYHKMKLNQLKQK